MELTNFRPLIQNMIFFKFHVQVSLKNQAEKSKNRDFGTFRDQSPHPPQHRGAKIFDFLAEMSPNICFPT